MELVSLVCARVARFDPHTMATTAFKDKSKPDDVRLSNITAGRAVADAVRTSLGPRGMDKMITFGRGEVCIC